MLSILIIPMLVHSAAAGIFRCTGYYASDTCDVTLSLNHCKNTIHLKWQPLRFPGNPQWAMTHRTYCSVTWDGQNATEERKFKPERCEKILEILASGFEGHPDVPWQDANCTNLGGPDGILYLTQHYDRPEPLPHFQAPLVAKDPEPRAIRLEDARACVLSNDHKKRVVTCPVLPPRVQSWLAKALAAFEVELIIQNPVR